MKTSNNFKTGVCFGLLADVSFIVLAILLRGVKMMDTNSSTPTTTSTLSVAEWWLFLAFFIALPVIFGLFGTWFIKSDK